MEEQILVEHDQIYCYVQTCDGIEAVSARSKVLVLSC